MYIDTLSPTLTTFTGGQTTMVNSLKLELVRKYEDFSAYFTSKTTMPFVYFYTNQTTHEIDIHLIYDCKSQLDKVSILVPNLVFFVPKLSYR